MGKDSETSQSSDTIYHIHSILQDIDGKITAINKSYAIIEFDLEGHIITANQNFLDLTGFKQNELIHCHYDDLVPSDFLNSVEYKEFWNQLKSGHYQVLEHKIYKQDRTELWVQVSFNPINDLNGRATKIMSFVLDITKRKETSERMENIFNHAVDGLITIDENARIESFNPAAEKIFGYKASEVKNKNINILMPEPFHSRHDNYLKNYYTTGHKKIIGVGREVEGKHKNGRVFPLDLAVSEISISGKRLFSGIIRDISERKDAESRLKEYTKALEKQHVKLELAKNKANNASKHKDEFLANMSHEIRTPLSTIIGITELMLHTNLDFKQRSYINIVLNAAKSLLNIISDILDISQIESGKLSLEQTTFDLMALIHESTTFLSYKALDKSIEFIIHYHIDVPQWFIGDPERIRQIIVNLTGNAIKFTEKGYIAIVVSLEKEYANIEQHQTCIKIEVIDTGIGIPKASQSEIFKNFTQVEAASTKKNSGTGLGLGICKSLVQLMQGEIGVESSVKKKSGTKFWVKVPLGQTPPMSKTVTAKQLHLNVLIVDDLDINGQILQEQLGEMQITSTFIQDAKHVIRTLTNAKEENKLFQIAIIDFEMPAITGDILARQIKTTPGLENIIIILLASLEKAEKISKSSMPYIQQIINKPIHPYDIREKIIKAYKSSQGDKKDHFKDKSSITKVDIHKDMSQGATIKIDGRILVAEDNRVNAFMTQEVLSNFGCQVDLCHNGEQAYQMATSNIYDLILMDCHMPIMDGYEATKKTKAYWEKENIVETPIIALTANAMKSDKEVCLQSGMVDYICKPINEDSLFKALLHWLPSQKIENTPTDNVISLIDSLMIKTQKQVLQDTYPEVNKILVEQIKIIINNLELKLDSITSLHWITMLHNISALCNVLGFKNISKYINKVADDSILFHHPEQSNTKLKKELLDELVIQLDVAQKAAVNDGC